MTQHLNTEYLTDYLHHALSPEDDARVYEHVESCAACRALYQEEAKLTEMLRAVARGQEREMPAGVAARIWEQVEHGAERPAFWEHVRAILRPAIALPVAAAIALAAYFGPAYLAGRNAPHSIDAMYYLQDHANMNGTVPFSDSAVMPASLQNDRSFDQSPVGIGAVVMTADANR